MTKHGKRNETIRRLRLEGHSIRQIEKIVGCSRSVVSYHCRGLRSNNPPNLIGQRAATRANSEKWRKRRTDVRRLGQREWVRVRGNPFLLAMIAVYWCEGTKRGPKDTRSFVVTNSDPGIIKIALRGLEILRLDTSVVLTVEIFPEHERQRCKDKWEQFLGRKVEIRRKKKRNPQTRLFSSYGVCVLYVRESFELWHKMMSWIDCWRAEFGIEESCQIAASSNG